MVSALCLISCSKDYYDIIPDRSPAIARIDPAGLQQESSGESRGFESLFPFSAGLDADRDIYGFISPAEYYGLVFSVSDADRVGQKISGNRSFSPAGKADDIQFAIWKERWCIAWNDNALMMLGPVVPTEMDFTRRTVCAMFRSRNKMSDGPLFPLLDKRTAPISVVSRAYVLPMMLRTLVSMQSGGGEASDSATVVSDIHMKDGRIECSSELIYPESSGVPAQGSVRRIAHGRNNVVIPGGAVGIMYTGLDGKRLADELNGNKDIRRILSSVSADINISEILGAISGDASVIPGGMGSDGRMSLQITAAAADRAFLKDVPLWQKRINSGGSAMLQNTGGDMYLYRNRNTSFRFGFMNDGRLLIDFSPLSVAKPAEVRADTLTEYVKAGSFYHAHIRGDRLAGLPYIKGLFDGALSSLLSGYPSIVASAPDREHSSVVLSKAPENHKLRKNK